MHADTFCIGISLKIQIGSIHLVNDSVSIVQYLYQYLYQRRRFVLIR